MDKKFEKIKDFIEKHSNVPNLQFNPEIKLELPIDPYSKNYDERRKAAYYLLLVASIDEGNVVGSAGNARKLMIRLYNNFEENLFEITDEKVI